MVKVSNVILGLGETGLSYARYLVARGEVFMVLDDAVSSDRLAALRLAALHWSTRPAVLQTSGKSMKIVLHWGGA